MALDPMAPTDTSPSSAVEVDSILAPFEGLETLDPLVGHRRHQRRVAPPCRPVPIRLLQPDGAPRTDWFASDILDTSQGGACLLIMDSHALNVSDRLLLDFKAHLGSGLLVLSGRVRWFVRTCGVMTVGVGFDEPLQGLPQLLPERRRRLRDPMEDSRRQEGG